jgi:hypothetical protein
MTYLRTARQLGHDSLPELADLTRAPTGTTIDLGWTTRPPPHRTDHRGTLLTLLTT